MICGKRVRFRAIEEEDLPYLLAWFNDPHISQMVGGWDFPTSMAQQKEWFKRSLSDANTQRWIVENHDGDRLGLTGLWNIDRHNGHGLTALKLGAEGRGKGYGTDAILLVCAYAFYQVGLRRLWSEILEYNIPSYRAYVDKCGWKVEGVLREHAFRDGAYHNQFRIGLLKTDFEAYLAGADYLPTARLPVVQVAPEHLATPFMEQLK